MYQDLDLKKKTLKDITSTSYLYKKSNVIQTILIETQIFTLWPTIKIEYNLILKSHQVFFLMLF